ncbi:hypothetical protein [Phytohabitans kaempferiae]|uniref:Uncharacterized protein n=1 Tax=Phytohabitans kaempferiae TaxID=1620943 RepID=A0ABV6MB79_9ACTN
MGDPRTDGEKPIEPDELQRRVARQEGAGYEPTDADAAARRHDEHTRRVGSAGGGQYGAGREDG